MVEGKEKVTIFDIRVGIKVTKGQICGDSRSLGYIQTMYQGSVLLSQSAQTCFSRLSSSTIIS